MAGRCGEDYLQLFVEEGDWYDRIVLGTLLPGWAWKSLPRPGRAWLRNYISGVLLYFVSSFLWCFYIYYLKRNVYVPKDGILSNKAMLLQILVAMKSMPFNSVVPTLSEYMIQRGWTRCFSSISDVGFAFHPLDGILQALPQVITLFLVPAHLMTHMVLFFCEGVWITNIHDCIHGQVWPMMGAGYHTIHHTTYCHNYGHYTILMDWMFGTLHRPEEDLKKGS